MGNPYIYDGDCTIGITRYLARSVEMGGLADFNYPAACWHYTVLDAFIPPDDSSVNCLAPYNLCESIYCPDKYAALIDAMVSMNAQFIQRAYAAAGGKEDYFFPGERWYCLGAQVVRDINYAYDCAGLRRPIIQGFVGEYMDLNKFKDMQKWTDGVDRHIPDRVISRYFEFFPDDFDKPDPQQPGMTYGQYYATSHYFERDRVTALNASTHTLEFDISLLECRMWMFYQAMTLIDFGYTAIVMGFYPVYTEKERPGNHDGLPAYFQLERLTSAIRRYAQTCGEAGFVLLSGEPLMHETSAKWAGTDNLIFDFDSRAMRPREITLPLQTNGDTGCNDPISQAVLDAFNNSPCGPINGSPQATTTPLPAVVDPCVINGFGGTSGGISPLGCRYEQVPYTVHFDGFSGMDIPHAGQPSSAGSNGYGLSTLTWGYDDHRWFDRLSSECKQWWFNYFYCDRRNFLQGVGFLTIPGIISMNFLEKNDIIPTGPGYADGKSLISDDPQLLASIVNGALAVNSHPSLQVTGFCASPNECRGDCHGSTINDPNYVFQTAKCYYKLEVLNKDCSSVYSIHITDPEGKEQSQVIGTEEIFFPSVTGNYQIKIRQDNLGLPAASYGTQEISRTVYMESEYCSVVPIRSCSQTLTVSTECSASTATTRSYRVSIQTTDNSANIQNIRTLNDASWLDSVQFINSHKVNAVFRTPVSADSRLAIMVDVARDSIMHILLWDDLPGCSGDQPMGNWMTPAITVKVFPNPVENNLQVKLISSTSTLASLKVFNSLSALQWSNDLPLNKGDNSLSMDVSAFPSGVYFLQVYTPEISGNANFVKVGH